MVGDGGLPVALGSVAEETDAAQRETQTTMGLDQRLIARQGDNSFMDLLVELEVARHVAGTMGDQHRLVHLRNVADAIGRAMAAGQRAGEAFKLRQQFQHLSRFVGPKRAHGEPALRQVLDQSVEDQQLQRLADRRPRYAE